MIIMTKGEAALLAATRLFPYGVEMWGAHGTLTLRADVSIYGGCGVRG